MVHLDIILAPTQGTVDNITSCLADGLYTPETTFTRNTGVTPAGSNTIDVDTDGDGVTDFTFCEGIDTIVSANDCTGGVGTDYMVTEFSITDKTLTINSAPEHTGVQGRSVVAVMNGAGLGPAVVNNEQHVILTTQLVITNPSLCRSMIVNTEMTEKFTANQIVPGSSISALGSYFIDTVIAGTAYIQLTSPFPNQAPLGGATLRQGGTGTSTRPTIIPPGGTITIDAELTVTLLSIGSEYGETNFATLILAAQGWTI